MRKIRKIVFLIAAAILFTLFGCSNNPDENDIPQEIKTEKTSETEEKSKKQEKEDNKTTSNESNDTTTEAENNDTGDEPTDSIAEEIVKLPAPQDLKITATTTSSISISFASVSDAKAYKLWCGKSSSFDAADEYDYITVTSIRIPGLESDTTYYIWIAAYDEAYNRGEISSYISGKTEEQKTESSASNSSETSSSNNSESSSSNNTSDSSSNDSNNSSTSSNKTKTEIKVSAPTISSIQFTTNEKGLKITWEGSSYKGTTYTVYRATSKNASYKQVVEGLTTPAYDDLNVDLKTLDNAYFYKIQAVSSTGYKSEQSLAKGVTMKQPVLAEIYLPKKKKQSNGKYHYYSGGEVKINGVKVIKNGNINSTGYLSVQSRYKWRTEEKITSKTKQTQTSWKDWKNDIEFLPSRKYFIKILDGTVEYETNLELE